MFNPQLALAASTNPPNDNTQKLFKRVTDLVQTEHADIFHYKHELQASANKLRLVLLAPQKAEQADELISWTQNTPTTQHIVTLRVDDPLFSGPRSSVMPDGVLFPNCSRRVLKSQILQACHRKAAKQNLALYIGSRDRDFATVQDICGQRRLWWKSTTFLNDSNPRDMGEVTRSQIGLVLIEPDALSGPVIEFVTLMRKERKFDLPIIVCLRRVSLLKAEHRLLFDRFVSFPGSRRDWWACLRQLSYYASSVTAAIFEFEAVRRAHAVNARASTLRALHKLVSVCPEHDKATLYLARLLQKHGRYHRAIHFFQKTIKINPYILEPYLELHALLLNSRQTNQILKLEREIARRVSSATLRQVNSGLWLTTALILER